MAFWWIFVSYLPIFPCVSLILYCWCIPVQKVDVCTWGVQTDLMSSPPMFNHILISGTTTPSSTITVLVFAALVSITHTFEIPALCVTPMDSCCMQTCLNTPHHHCPLWHCPALSLPFTHLPCCLAAEDTLYMGSSMGTFNLLTMMCGTIMGETSDAQPMCRNCVPRWMTRMFTLWWPCMALMLSYEPQEPIPHTTQLTSCTFCQDSIQHTAPCILLPQCSALSNTNGNKWVWGEMVSSE